MGPVSRGGDDLSRRRATGDRGATQLAAVAIVGAVALGGGAVGYGAQQALGDDDSAPEPVVIEADEERGSIATFDCPDGEMIGELHGGDRIYLTGVHEETDGWVRTRDPLSPETIWWIGDERLVADSNLDDLPEVGCDDPDELPEDESDDGGGDEVAAADTTTSAPPDTTPSTVLVETPQGPQVVIVQPGQPLPPNVASGGGSSGGSTGGNTGGNTGGGGGPTPTQPPDTTGPSLSVSISPHDIWEQDGVVICPANYPRQATVTANVSDASGVAQVRATWTVGNVNENKILSGGAVRTAPIGPYPYHTVVSSSQPTITVNVTATDNAGNSTVRSATFVLHSTDQCFG